MAIRFSRYTPPTRRVAPLNWTGDPLAGVRKAGISSAMASAGLAYDKSLYTPGSAESRALFAPSAYPTGYQSTSLGELGRNLTKFGSGGRPGMASVSFPVSQSMMNPNLASTPPAAPVVAAQAPPAGAAGPLGATGPTSPALTPVDPVSNPYFEQPSVDSQLGAPAVNPGAPETIPANPLMVQSAETNGRDMSSAAQTQRFYDRKFARTSHDPATRMAARRIDGTAPNVSPQRAPVTFSSTNPDGTANGHSDWSPY